MDHPTLLQIDGLADALDDYGYGHFDIFQLKDKISIAQYKRLYALLFNRSYDELEKMLLQFNIKCNKSEISAGEQLYLEQKKKINL